MKIKHIAIALGMGAMMASCSVQRSPLPYFTDIETTIKEGTSVPTSDYNVKVQPDDELFITVYSNNPASSAMFNLPFSNPATSDKLKESTTPRQLTYIVNSQGDINIPNLGKLHVEGLTVEQIQKKVTDLVAKSVEDPVVRVELVNFRVNVAGEVRRPGSLNVSRNRYSVLDALADAGDLTEFGERNNVLLIREENGERTYHRLNLNSADLLTSPYFYLKQNDYIYVEPNRIREENSKYNQNNAFKMQVISTIVSAASVVASLIIAFAVK